MTMHRRGILGAIAALPFIPQAKAQSQRLTLALDATQFTAALHEYRGEVMALGQAVGHQVALRPYVELGDLGVPNRLRGAYINEDGCAV